MNTTPRSQPSVPASLLAFGALWGLVAFCLAFPYERHTWIDHEVMNGGASGTAMSQPPHPHLWSALCLASAICAGGAPILARWIPRVAGIFSLAPLVPLAIESSGLNVSLASVASLVGVAIVAIHRNRRVGVLVGALALVIPAIFAFVDYSALWVIRDVIVSASGADLSKRLLMFALYTAAVALALGAAMALSLAASRRDDRQAVAVRTAEVDARAALAAGSAGAQVSGPGYQRS